MIFRNIRRFCKIIIKTQESRDLVNQVPVHLKPYNPQRYQVPSKKIKQYSGYALLQVDPMPRATIMKLAYNILHRMKDFPQQVFYRIYTEQKAKWVMKLVDENQDVQQIEKALGVQSIQFFIMQYRQEFLNIDYFLENKIWQEKNTQNELALLQQVHEKKKKDPKYKRGPRTQSDFI